MPLTKQQLKKLLQKRGVVRATLTKLTGQIDNKVEGPDPNLDAIEELFDLLVEKEKALKTLDMEIEEGIEEEDLEDELMTVQRYEEDICVRKTKMKRALKRRDDDGQSSVSSKNTHRYAVKLPRLIIEKFNGDVSLWQTFWSQFDMAVHTNPDLSQADKFNYLKSYLTGRAANAITGLALTAENYDSAVKMLENRFGRKDLLINAHMNKLLNLTPVKRASDIVALRKLHDEIEIQVRSLSALNVVSDMYGSLLCPILMKMIPENITLEFSRQRDDDDMLKVDDLMKFLKREVESRERTSNLININPQSATKETEQYSNRPNKLEQRRVSYRASTAALYTGAPQNCIFCNKPDHNSKQCVENTVEQRREFLKKQGRCFVCLGTRHMARTCKAHVSCENCGRRHHKVVCTQNNGVDGTTQSTHHSDSRARGAQQIQGPVGLQTDATVTCNSGNGNVLLQTATVWVVSPNKCKSMITRCLLDGGSQRSFIRTESARKLNLPVIGSELINLHTFGSLEPKRIHCNKVRAKLTDVRNGQAIEIELLESPQVCTSLMAVPGEPLRTELENRGMLLADVNVYGMQGQDVDILIGADYYWSVVTGRIERLEDGLVAVESMFGWLIQGTVAAMQVSTDITNVGVMHIDVDNKMLSEQLRSFWELESLGIKHERETKMSVDDENTLEQFKETITHTGERYEVQLPWRTETLKLSSNYTIAENRFNRLMRRFKHDDRYFARYSEVINDYVENKIIEHVQTESTSNPLYYLPHHAIVKEERATTKVRIVFDASSHDRNSASLNECLQTGPNLNPELLSVLLKFRQNKIAFMADIEKAFLQISINEKDRDALRFLWTKGAPSSDNENEQMSIMRMTRVPFGVTTSPFLLSATIKHHLERFENEYPNTVKALRETLYVDDFLCGGDDVDTAYQLYTESKEIISKAGMLMYKWKTNSLELQDKWQEKKMEPCATNPIKVLGLKWRTESDDFMFDLTSILKVSRNIKCTKRNVLQTVARIFDPIGFLSPFTVRAKRLFQETWERGLEWDDELPDDLTLKWKEWYGELQTVEAMVIPRPYDTGSQSPVTERQLHVFCDASETAYCAVGYLRTIRPEGSTCTLICSKTKVAPLKKVTLPRLELLGALIGARLCKYVTDTIDKPMQSYLWTDSTIALHWIRGSAKQWKPFVANRVIEIQKLSEPENWRHCPGKDNPADLGTRGLSAENLKSQTLWWNGPQWFRETSLTHIELDSNIGPSRQEPTEEIVKQYQVATEPQCPTENTIFPLEKYSRLSTVLRITAWVHRFVFNTRNKSKRQGALTATEIDAAELHWIAATQKKGFPREVKELQMGMDVHKQSKIKDLNPFLDDDGLIRVGGRLQKSKLSYGQKHPWILPARDKFTELQVKSAHECVFHNGLQNTLTQLRERFWIPRGRQVTKKILNCCFICKRFRIKASQEITAPLPADRITESAPFEVTGVDFAGPLYVKPNHKKAYIAIFTCAVTRAVHLELISDLSTPSFLLAFRRFIARRGICGTLYSDNAKTFKRASEDLNELWKSMKSNQVKEFFAEKRINWKFIVERAAWWGGIWERMVRSVKSSLKKVMGRAFLNFEELQTFQTEVEAVINSRPLTYVDNDSDVEPLTPAHFLTGKRLTTLPPQTVKESCISQGNRRDINKRWRYRERLINGFWNRWKCEYLMELKSAHLTSTKTTTPLKKGDVVIVHDHMLPRQLWRMGRIQEVFPGRDGKIRSCAIQLPGMKMIRRPIQLLYNLEITND